MTRIRPLRDLPGCIDLLAAWHHAQWGRLYSDWPLPVARSELQDHATRYSIPTTLVLEDAAGPVGSVSVVTVDAEELTAFGSPWLASLFVRPDARGLGHGKALVRAAVALAAQSGVSRLCLFTPGQRAFHESLGWAYRGDATLGTTTVALMDITPR